MNQAPCPPTPWHLQGDAIALFERDGVRLLVHYTHSPVGAYDECALAQLHSFRALQVLAGRFIAPVIAPTVVEMQVNSPRSMQCGRALWGFPKTLAALNWQSNGTHIAFEASGFEASIPEVPRQKWRFRCAPFGLPVKLHAHVVQVLAGSDVRVSMKLRARARLAWRGQQWGILLENFDFVVEAPQKL